MHRLNLLFSLISLSVLLTTIERFSFTTKILLQPYSFMRLHELFQIIFLLLFSIIISFFMLREISHNFEILKKGQGMLLGLLFFVGLYFFATGNGLHEISSFNFNYFCNPHKFSGELCGGFFFNDYYTGNIFFFIGTTLMTAPLLLLEKIKPTTTFKKKDLPLLLLNAGLYAFAIFAYAAFDRVWIGFIYSFVVMCIADILFLRVRKRFLQYPFITYTAVIYTLATIAALIVRISS